MDTELLISIVIFLLLLFASGFFSGSEVALFSLSSGALHRMRERASPADLRVIRLLGQPRRLLISILIGNTIVNTGAAIIAAFLALRFARLFGFNENLAVFVEIVAVTFLIVVISEITPKVLAAKNPERFARTTIFPLYVVLVLFYPLVEVLAWLTASVQRRVRVDRRRAAIGRQELKTLFDVGRERGTVPRDEGGIMHGLVDLGERIVREVMVPRVNMAALELGMPVAEAMKLIRAAGYSRIPVYKENLDDVQGILYAKDLLPFLKSRRRVSESKLSSLIRPALFVPETKRIGQLLRVFQQKKIHIAIVVDEYGGTAGLVTFRDLVDEIVGEIREDADRTQVLYERVDERTLLFDARIDVHEAARILGVSLTDGEAEYDTLGGFLFHLFGRIPLEQQTISFKNLQFTVEKVEERRISKVLVVRQPQDSASR